MKYISYFPALGLFALLLINCEEKKPVSKFVQVDSQVSGLLFNNQLAENDSINIIDNEFVYNGAGVALGDLNGDGRMIYFLLEIR
ncbi:hypothetical protein Q2T40_03985 [Winogradskyella maritima]|nr:hypothetical protein [Winogradskyella maritima]